MATPEERTQAYKAVEAAAKALADAQERFSTAQVAVNQQRQYGGDTGNTSRTLYRNKQESDASEEYGKELDKRHKELLKQQKEQLAWQSKLDMKDASERDRINMEDAKAVEKANKEAERIAKLAAKEQSATSKSMSDAVSEFGRAVTTNSQHAIQAARLEIKNPQMSFFKGSIQKFPD